MPRAFRVSLAVRYQPIIIFLKIVHSAAKTEILKYELPCADGYTGFWEKNLTIQHPLASVELVAWDSSGTLLISREAALIRRFREVFPLSEDLKEHNEKCRQNLI